MRADKNEIVVWVNIYERQPGGSLFPLMPAWSKEDADKGASTRPWKRVGVARITLHRDQWDK